MKEVKFLFEKFNPNPFAQEGKKHDKGDCVIRAICKATGMGWFDVYDELCAIGRLIGDWGDRKHVYSQMIESKGFMKVAVPRVKGKKATTVEQFCKDHPEGTFILRLAHHLTCVVDGVCYDTWYPQDYTVYLYWIKK